MSNSSTIAGEQQHQLDLTPTTWEVIHVWYYKPGQEHMARDRRRN